MDEFDKALRRHRRGDLYGRPGWVVALPQSLCSLALWFVCIVVLMRQEINLLDRCNTRARSVTPSAHC